MSAGDTHGPRAPYRLALAVTAACGLALVTLFALAPTLDIAVARIFYVGDNRFAFSPPSLGDFTRESLRWLFRAAVAASVAGLVLAVFRGRRLLGWSFRAWAFAFSAFTLGVGVVTGLLLKGLWGRARPHLITEFGGEAKFTPALIPADQCSWNCSFVSGEASNIFMLGFILVLLLAPRDWRAWVVAVAGGLFSGYIRVGAGGHFLSDVTLAGVLMALVALGLHWWMFVRSPALFADDGAAVGWLRRTLRARGPLPPQAAG